MKVEDRRVAAERELISIKLENVNVKRQLEQTRQNLHSAKVSVISFTALSE